jgi:hypothetical protein
MQREVREMLEPDAVFEKPARKDHIRLLEQRMQSGD